MRSKLMERLRRTMLFVLGGNEKVLTIDAIDTPYFDIKDPEGLERHTRQAKDMGYNGKAMIHPLQVKEAFAISSNFFLFQPINVL